MASSVIGALRVNLGLDSAQFSTGAKQAQNSMGGLKKSIVANGAAIAAAAVAAATAITAFALKYSGDIDRTAKSARRLDASVAEFRSMELAAGEAGVETNALADSVQTMNRELAKGGKGAKSALGQLGIDAEAFKKQRPMEQLATLSDAIQKTGATSGETSAILQQLGIRNKEMILALVSGGDAFRNASKDIADYGLALSDIDAASIEKANDQIGRMGLIGQYLGDKLALAIVPALGAMAQAMTDSLREGGLLRTMIDGLVGNLDVMAYSAGIVVAAFGVNYVGALALATLSTFSFAGALAVLRTALITSGIGVIVVAAGYLIAKFVDLVVASGGFGNAMSMLGDVAVEVWARIGMGADALVAGMAAGWEGMKSTFFYALHDMLDGFSKLISNIASGINSVFGTSLNTSPMMGALTSLNKAGNDAAVDMQSAGKAAFDAWADATGPLKTVQALRDAVAGSKAELDATVPSVNSLGEALEGAGGKGASAAKKIKDSAKEIADAANKGAEKIGSMFTSLLDSSKSLRASIGDLIMEIAKMQLMNGFKSLFGAGGAFSGVGSFIGGLIGKNAAGTNHWKGGLTSINERGGEIVDLPSGTRIIPHDVSNRMAARQGDGFAVRVIGGDLTLTDGGQIMARVHVVAEETTKSGLRQVPAILAEQGKRRD